MIRAIATTLAPSGAEVRALIRCFIAALFACTTLVTVSHMRVVNAEDDCANPTLIVQRVPIIDQLVCIWESE